MILKDVMIAFDFSKRNYPDTPQVKVEMPSIQR